MDETMMLWIHFGGMPVIIFGFMLVYRIWPDWDVLEINSPGSNDSAFIGYFLMLMLWPLFAGVLALAGVVFGGFYLLWWLSGKVAEQFVPKTKDDTE